MDSYQVGETIKKLRKDNNLTQKEFADKLGVTYQAVSKWENGKNMPDIGILQDISKIFNINMDELLTGNKINKNNNIKILIGGIIILIIIIVIFLFIIINNNSNFEFKTITSNCDEFEITGSAAYNNKKTSIYISDVDYCGKENNTIYKEFSCNLYEEYRNTQTIIGTCGEDYDGGTLSEFVERVELNVNNYVASCKMFASSMLYMEIEAKDNNDRITTYKIPINLEENCKN